MSVDSSLDRPLDPPVSAEAFAEVRRARVRHAEGDLRGALPHFQQALQLAGEHPGLLVEIAVLAFAGGDSVAAEQLLRRSLARRDDADTRLNLAIAVYQQQRFAEAATLFSAVFGQVTVTSELADAYAFALERSGAADAALQVREQVLAQSPMATHALWLATTLLRLGRHAALQARLDDWLARFPGSAELLGLAAEHALGQGDYPRGFALLARRLALTGTGIDEPQLAACPRWDGEPFAGLLLVTLEPHLGEEILATSLLLPLIECGQRACIEVDRRLLPLLRRSMPSLAFVARGEGALPVSLRGGENCRLATTVDLARHFRREFRLPGTPGWLRCDAARRDQLRAACRQRWPGRKLVGISWRSLRRYKDLDLKSIPLPALAKTLSLPDTQFIALQYGDARADLDALAGTGLPVPWQDPDIDVTEDLDALAAQLCALDVFVTVSNTTAHLAGALGVPTIVLLPEAFPVFWHWGHAGEECTWYGSVRLLRAAAGSDVGTLDAELAERLRGMSRAAPAGDA